MCADGMHLQHARARRVVVDAVLLAGGEECNQRVQPGNCFFTVEQRHPLDEARTRGATGQRDARGWMSTSVLIPRPPAVPRTAASTCGSSNGLIRERASRAQQYVCNRPARGLRHVHPVQLVDGDHRRRRHRGQADGRLSAALTVAGSMTNEATRMATDAATNSIANSGWPPLIPSAAPI